MKLLSVAGLAAFAAGVLGEDLLFHESFQGLEVQEATNLGLTTKVVTDAEWRAMTSADFAAYKAIVVGDNYCQSDESQLQVFADTSAAWGPAVTGNVIIIGTDPTWHGKTVLIDNSITFAADAKSLAGASQTGLYFALSCYYDGSADVDIPALSYFGQFTVGGVPSCYNEAHIVASSPALGALTDADLSDWSCSVHEAFSQYPSVGVNGFQALVIADGVVTTGTQTYGDGHSGLPYIVSRGATPAGCGDGVWDASLGEECDDSNTEDGDGCSKSCKCESGVANGDGTCGLSSTTSTETTTTTTTTTETSTTTNTETTTDVTSTTTTISTTTTLTTVATILVTETYDHTNTVTSTVETTLTTVIPTYQTSVVTIPAYGSGWDHDGSGTPTGTFSAPPYITPSVPSTSCIGIEIVVSSTSTFQKPIYNTPIPTMPCYVCALKDQGIATDKGFITAITTHCASPVPATIKPCSTCDTTTMTETCKWEKTPDPTAFVPAAYTTYAPHDHKGQQGGSGSGATPTGAYTPADADASATATGWGYGAGSTLVSSYVEAASTGADSWESPDVASTGYSWSGSESGSGYSYATPDATATAGNGTGVWTYTGGASSNTQMSVVTVFGVLIAALAL